MDSIFTENILARLMFPEEKGWILGGVPALDCCDSLLLLYCFCWHCFCWGLDEVKGRVKRLWRIIKILNDFSVLGEGWLMIFGVHLPCNGALKTAWGKGSGLSWGDRFSGLCGPL